MRIAILSDTHDNIWKLSDILAAMEQAGAEVLVFCGDLCAPFTLKQIGEHFCGPVHVVLGNNDGDPLMLCKIADGLDNVSLHGPFAYLTLDGRYLLASDQGHVYRWDAAELARRFRPSAATAR